MFDNVVVLSTQVAEFSQRELSNEVLQRNFGVTLGG